MRIHILPLLLCAALCLACTGCGAEQPAPAPTEAPAPTATPTPTPTPEPAPALTPAPGQFVFTRENFPRLDGSTSLVPLAEAVTAVLLGETREEAADLVHFNRTTQSYRNLMQGNCDLLLAATPAQSVKDEYEMSGFECEMARIASDALVFVVSADNPVDSLTVEQIQRIYMGEITNWKEVGGDDVEIIPFQRNAEAGSQTGMKNLVMKDLPLMEPPKAYVIESMMGLMEAVRNFDGSAGAIGYSVYYYANDMRMAEGLKILAVDGVEPEPETIADREYPFIASYYATIRTDEPEDSPTRRMYDWLQGAEGSALIEAMGYVPSGGAK